MPNQTFTSNITGLEPPRIEPVYCQVEVGGKKETKPSI